MFKIISLNIKMYFHIFELTNNKYFIIFNNYEIYNLDMANMEYDSNQWIKLYGFNKHIESIYTNNISLVSKYLIKYGITNSRSNVKPFDSVILNYKILIDLCSYSGETDKWLYYGSNHLERIKNRKSLSKQLC